jgi:hypothetical protein
VYCKPCHNAKGRESRERHGGARRYHLWRRYGITLEAVEELHAMQGGTCAICGVAEPRHVDHDHVSGAVRGLLCFNCNGGLGQFRDDPTLLLAAVDYLQRTRRPSLRDSLASLGRV